MKFFRRGDRMFALLKRCALLVALVLPLPSLAADVQPAEAGSKAKLQFDRTSGRLSLVKARIEVNGRRQLELAKGESGDVLIEPGRTLIKIDSAYSPGQMLFSFTSEKGGEYRFEVFDSIDKVDAAHLFGQPPKVSNGEIVESSGVLKATLFSAKAPAPASAPTPAPASAPAAPASLPAKVEPVPQAAPPIVVEPPAPVPAQGGDKPTTPASSIKTQLEELKKLYDQGLISNEVYQAKQKKILEGL
jgi:hypothetical protein